MALRNLASKLNLRTLGSVGMGATATAAARSASSLPYVFDSIVEFTVIDEKGVRHTCRGIEGQSVSEALVEHSVDTLGVEFMTPTPTGRNMVDCHLYVANECLELLPVKTDEEADNLVHISTDLRSNSRLGSSITLSSETSGIVVAIGSVLPFDTP